MHVCPHCEWDEAVISNYATATFYSVHLLSKHFVFCVVKNRALYCKTNSNND